MARAQRHQPGGIIGLADCLAGDGGALNADLMRCGFSLADIGGRLGWTDVLAVRTHPRNDAAQLGDDERRAWTSGATDAWLLACLRDEVCALRMMLAGRPSDFRPLPRPGDGGGTTVGSDAIPIRDFESWWFDG